MRPDSRKEKIKYCGAASAGAARGELREFALSLTIAACARSEL